MKIAVYPGTFDPITYGHLDVIRRAADIFDRVIVTLAVHSRKQPLFSIEERLKMISDAVRDFPGVEVERWDGLLVEFAEMRKASAIVRGLRAVSDFDYEFQIALTNRILSDKVATVFLMPGEKYTYLNSSIVREVAKHGGNVSEFVPPAIAHALKQKFEVKT
jgi:pantetheine-phosphate adenylyltransferase